jgi:hypothetical protein
MVKKKTEKQIIAEVSKLIAEQTLQETEPKSHSKIKWPKVDQGSHLTVRTFENGRTELIWDDEALLRDVKNAILSYESRIPVLETKKAKNARAKKD